MLDPVPFYRRLLEEWPDAASIWADLARALLDGGRSEAALDAADVAVSLDPSLVQGWLTRGLACKTLHRFAAAAASFGQADRLAPGRGAVLAALGTSLVVLGRQAEAEACLIRAIACDPNLTEAHASLGSLYVRQGRFAAAEEASRRALALAPDCVVAHQNLAGVLARTRPEEARAHRDAAYGRQQIFIETAARPRWTILVLCAADAANVPLGALLPAETTTLIKWFIEYAPPGQDNALPSHDLVFNAIGDADFAALAIAPVQRFLSTCRRPVLNHPARVARTARFMADTVFQGIADIVVPRVLRLSRGADAAVTIAAAGLTVPVILRPVGSHGGDGVRQVATSAELAELGRCDRGLYVTEFIDSRVADRLYRKYRVIFIDRVPYPYHLAISRHWLVHYRTADMEGNVEHREEERRFLDDPAGAIGPAAMRALAEIGARLDLDYAGIDFAVLPDGRLLVFEANATMLVHREETALFAYKNPAVRRIAEAFEAMLRARAAPAR